MAIGFLREITLISVAIISIVSGNCVHGDDLNTFPSNLELPQREQTFELQYRLFLTNPITQRELNLDSEQIKKIAEKFNEVQEFVWKQKEESKLNNGVLDVQKRSKQFREVMSSWNTDLSKIPTTDQLKRLRELQVWLFGSDIFAHPVLLKEMKITESDQRRFFEILREVNSSNTRISKETFVKLRETRQRSAGQDLAPEPAGIEQEILKVGRQRARAESDRALLKILALLTDEQRNLYFRLCGPAPVFDLNDIDVNIRFEKPKHDLVPSVPAPAPKLPPP